jgi:nitrogen-specific signal transduction histidine kinase/CheY-like chemotaxis protein
MTDSHTAMTRTITNPLPPSLKLEALSQLAEGVAHDFSNFFTVIQGHSARLLADEHLSPETRASLTEIYTAGERSANLLRQLLIFSGRQSLRRQTLEVNEIMSDVADMCPGLLGREIVLHQDYAVPLPPISADAGMLEQALLKLAANACDALPNGGHLHLQTARMAIDQERASQNPAARPGEFVCLSVRDTGCGIAPEILPRIFEPFFTTSAPGKGIGMGLATVHGIVQQHEGWVEVESQVGHGTTFRVFLPVLPPQAVEARAPSAPANLHRSNETILLVEDESALRGLLVLLLQQQGYRVLEAASGAEAIKVWARHQARIALLFTDLVLPDDLSGWELAERLRAEKPVLKVILTSAFRPEMLGQVFTANGPIHFLQKPYPPRQVAETVRQALDENNHGTRP